MQKQLEIKYQKASSTNVANDLAGRHGLVYARVSSKKQETEGSGLESQTGRCLNELRSMNVPHARTFQDSYSGGGDFMQRPAMRELLAFIDANPHKKFIVVFDDLKRLARDVEFHFKLKYAFKIRDVQLRCLNYNFDESPEGEFAEVVMSGHAQLERKQNARQVIQKMKARLESGYWAFARKKGYTMTPDPIHHMLAVPNKNSDILAQALEDFARGKLVRKVDVSRFLIEKGFLKKRPWEKYTDQVTLILRDSFYAGFVEYPQWDVARRQGHHRGLISPATFETIQARLRQNNTSVRIRKDTTEDFPMRGLILCSCGKPYTAAHCKGRSKSYIYYFCQNKTCNFYGKSVSKKSMEDEFVTVLKRGKLKPEIGKVIGEVFEAVWKEAINSLEKQDEQRGRVIEVLKGELRGLTERASKASNDRIRGVYENRMEEVSQTIENNLGQATNDSEHLFTPYKTALAKATKLIKSPYSVWRKVDAREKHSLYYFIFDQRIVYVKNEGYKTAEIPTAAMLFEEFVVEQPDYVHAPGLEPGTRCV